MTTKQLEQTIAEIEALPQGRPILLCNCPENPIESKKDEVFCNTDELLALAAEVKRLTDENKLFRDYVQELADHGFENARKILEGE